MTRGNFPTALLVATLVAAVATGCDSDAAQSPSDDRPVPPEPVETLVVSPTDFVDTFEVLGTAEPVESVEVSTEFPGDVLEAHVREGDTVERGDRLFRIDTESDEAGQQVLETQVEAAERELERMKRLRKEGLATAQQVDTARTELEQARDNLRQSRVNIGRHNVKAPIDGRVATRMIDQGEFAGSGVPLIEIVDFETIAVQARVPETEIRHVDTEDRTVDVDIPALQTTRQGRIDRIALRSSPATGTYNVEIHVDNADRAIRPGMRARTHFERQTYDNAIVVPRDAILEGFDGREVMVVEGDGETGQARVRSIETGPGTRDHIVVLEGLEPADRVIYRGHRGLVGESRVEVVDQHDQDDREGRP